MQTNANKRRQYRPQIFQSRCSVPYLFDKSGLNDFYKRIHDTWRLLHHQGSESLSPQAYVAYVPAPRADLEADLQLLSHRSSLLVVGSEKIKKSLLAFSPS